MSSADSGSRSIGAVTSGRLPLRKAVHVFLMMLLLVVVPAGVASAAAATPAGAQGDAAADSEGPLLGAVLEWGEDSAAGFSERLKAVPAIFGHEITFPVQESEHVHIRAMWWSWRCCGSWSGPGPDPLPLAHHPHLTSAPTRPA